MRVGVEKDMACLYKWEVRESERASLMEISPAKTGGQI